MTMTRLEHVNITVSDSNISARKLGVIFEWKVRWEGPARDGGHTVHLGSESDYLALYMAPAGRKIPATAPDAIGGLNHIGVVVGDLAEVEKRVVAAGYRMGDHHDYKPGKRFYFHDDDGIEFEVCSYTS